LNRIYKDVRDKGGKSHKQSIDNEQQRLEDNRQEKENKRLYKIALKKAK